MASWADTEDDGVEPACGMTPCRGQSGSQGHGTEARLEVLNNVRQLDGLFDRRIDQFIFIDLDGLKKGAGPNTYKFISDGTLPRTMAVLLFRRAPTAVDSSNEHMTNSQRRKNKAHGAAANRLRVTCAGCKNTLAVRPHLGANRFLIESPHDQPSATRLLMGFYIAHIATRNQKLARNVPMFLLSPEQGAAEVIDLVKKQNPEQAITQISIENLTSFEGIPSWGSPVSIVPARELFSDQLPNESGLDTARRRALKYLNDTKNLPATKPALEAALQPFLRLRGEVSSYSVVDMLKERKVWAQCADGCGTFYYPKKKDALKDANAKPKKAAKALNKHAENVDPHLKSGAKVVTAALAVLPPEDEWDQIQAVREEHDKAFQRWPPHINLMFPFVPENKFDEISDKMEKALKDFGPIRITMSHFSHFSHGKTNKTLFCEIDDEAKAVLKKLYARLELAFPMCAGSNDEFQPHLTLGQFSSDAAIAAKIKELSTDWEPIQFTLSHVSCLAREKDPDARFDTKKTYAFPGTLGQVPSAVKDENSPDEQVYRRVVSELESLNPVHRPQSVTDLNTFVRRLIQNTEVPLQDLMNLLTERDVVTVKRDLAVEERLTVVTYNRAAFKRLEKPASEKLVLADEPTALPAAVTPSAASADAVPFMKAAVYSGQKPGYSFKMGDLGLGYYTDKSK